MYLWFCQAADEYPVDEHGGERRWDVCQDEIGKSVSDTLFLAGFVFVFN